jgi:hypothetical protein
MPSSSLPSSPKSNKPDFNRLAVEICIHPRRAMREVLDYNPGYLHLELMVIMSAASGLVALRSGFGMVLLEFFLNLILMVVSIYSTALLLWLTGKPLGGKASFMAICATLLWPLLPALLATLFVAILAGTGGDLVEGLIQGVSYLYSFHLMNETLAEAQEFSMAKSFLNQTLAMVIMLSPALFFIGPILQLWHTLMPS